MVAILDADKARFPALDAFADPDHRPRCPAYSLAGPFCTRIRQTDSMKAAISESKRRRDKQERHNIDHGITPQSVQKKVKDIIEGIGGKRGSPYANKSSSKFRAADEQASYKKLSPPELAKKIKQMEKEMLDYAQNLEFEKAVVLRDSLELLKAELLELPG